MIRGDLQAVGISYAVEGPDGPEYADFHAQRHSFLTLVPDACVAVNQAMLDEDQQVDFKGKAKAFTRTYDFLSSIQRFANMG